MTEENIQTGWTKLYHPTGALITFPIFLTEEIRPETAKLVMRNVDNLITAGFLADAPGLEEGELMEEISHVARREGGDQTAIVDFYSSNMKLEKKFLHVYLNTQDDITAFESATGIKLDTLMTYDGKQAIERSDRNAPKYVRALLHNIKAVYKINPRWEQWKQAGGEGKEPHKRLLVRYEAGKQPAPKTGEPIKDKDGAVQYKKLSGELVTMIVQKTGLKPSLVTPILAKIPGDTISFESALKLVETNNEKEP